MTYPPNNDPQYGQQPPPYGQQPPQYGQPQPGQYGQPAAQYPAQQYGQQQYGTPGGYGAAAANYANWGQRAGGYLIDGVILLPFYIIAAILAGHGTFANLLAVII